MAPSLTIGRVARLAGVNAETIRYYQRRGLLEQPEKPLGGYRHYPSDMVKRIRFIKRAQGLGFTLDEIAGLLELEGESACDNTRDLAVHKAQLIDRKVADLERMRAALSDLIQQCDTRGSEACPIIQTLFED